jgi:hypothetical protein
MTCCLYKIDRRVLAIMIARGAGHDDVRVGIGPTSALRTKCSRVARVFLRRRFMWWSSERLPSGMMSLLRESLDRRTLDRLSFLPSPGESYSDVILLLAKSEQA